MIGLTNMDDRPHDLHVRIWRNEELRFEDEFHIERKGESGTSGNPAPVIQKPWMRDAGMFELSVRLDDRQETEERRFPDEDRPGDCYIASVTVHESGIVTVPFDAQSSVCSEESHQ